MEANKINVLSGLLVKVSASFATKRLHTVARYHRRQARLLPGFALADAFARLTENVTPQPLRPHASRAAFARSWSFVRCCLANHLSNNGFGGGLK